jgi:hippurate hydrolase
MLDMIEQRMSEIIRHTCLAHGMESEFEFVRSYPSTVNHQQAVELSRQVMIGIVGEDNVLEQRPTMGAEDFAYMLLSKPGSYCFIGNGNGGHRESNAGAGPCVLHNASYDFNDEIIPLGASYWVKLVETALA